MKVCVIGTGYVGLVAGAGFSDMGNDVVCADVDAAKIEKLERGEIPIYEPGLDRLVSHNTAEQRLRFTTDVAGAVAGAEAVFLAVGTPPAADGSADLSFVLAAAETIAKALTGPVVVVTKSTVPVGTGDKIEEIFRAHAKHPFAVVSNPEFLKEGDAVNDFLKPDRILLGTNDARAIDVLRALYAPFTRSEDRILVMDRRSAELTKYAANSMLATRISFMNDLAALCDRLGADIELVRKGIGGDERIGHKFLYAGAGFGGSCFPKDLRAAIQTAREAGMKLEILEAVVSVNDRQKRRLGEKILARFAGPGGAEVAAQSVRTGVRPLAARRVAVWGLAFKPGTDDIRDAPALVLIEQLLAAGAEVVATDPVAISAVKAWIGSEAAPAAVKGAGDRLRFEANNYDAAKGADALALVTEWREYRRPNFARLESAMKARLLFDGRNVWEPSEARAAGFEYFGVGRGKDG